jgi:hypothetical protein
VKAPIPETESAPAGVVVPGAHHEIPVRVVSPSANGSTSDSSARQLGNVGAPAPEPDLAAPSAAEVVLADTERAEAPAAKSAEHDERPLSRKEIDSIKRTMIQASIDAYDGPCPCPYNTAKNGSRCGRRSAYNRPGGESPLCFPDDITDEMVREFIAAQQR